MRCERWRAGLLDVHHRRIQRRQQLALAIPNADRVDKAPGPGIGIQAGELLAVLAFHTAFAQLVLLRADRHVERCTWIAPGARGIELTLLKPASAELADNQEDEKDLMPFPVLDACFALYAGEKLAPNEVYDVTVQMFPEYPPETLKAWVSKFARLFSASIYKWVQTPLSLHVGNLDLDRERALQLPVVQHSEWSS